MSNVISSKPNINLTQILPESLKDKFKNTWLGRKVTSLDSTHGVKIALGVAATAIAIYYLLSLALLIGSFAAGYSISKEVNSNKPRVIWDQNESSSKGDTRILGSIQSGADGKMNFILKTTLTSPDSKTVTDRERTTSEHGETVVDTKKTTSDDGKTIATQQSTQYTPHVQE